MFQVFPRTLFLHIRQLLLCAAQLQILLADVLPQLRYSSSSKCEKGLKRSVN